MLAIAVLAGSAVAQNPQGLKGHYVFLSATLVSDTITQSNATLTVSGGSSFLGREWTHTLTAYNPTPPNPGTALGGSALHQTYYRIRVKWVAHSDNPPNLFPDGQPAQWTGAESTGVRITGFWAAAPGGGGGEEMGTPPPNTTLYGEFLAYNAMTLSSPGTSISTTLNINPQHDHLEMSGTFTDIIEGGFTFSQQPEGWVGIGTFVQSGNVGWTTHCAPTEKAMGWGTTSMRRKLNTIGGLPVQ